MYNFRLIILLTHFNLSFSFNSLKSSARDMTQ